MSSTKVDRRLYHYRAQVVRVIDGDSCIMNIDTGFGIWLRGRRCRLAGICAPEIWGTPEPGAEEAKTWLEGQLAASGGDVVIKVDDEADKYGRCLVWIYLDNSPLTLNRQMIEKGFAVSYDDG